MVNTFLVDKDFRLSAARLDNLRLGKQRIEAYQILIIIKQLRFLADLFGLEDFPVNEDRPKLERQAWINRVLFKFKESGLIGLHIRANYIIHYYRGQQLPHKPDNSNKLVIDPHTNIIYEIKGKRKQTIVFSGTHNQIVLPGDELITTGFKTHPAICMWLGFEEALKDYINAHIETWISRGKNNTMKTYTVNPGYARPKWTNSDDVIKNFKSTLIEREIERQESLWYMAFDDFLEAWAHSPDHIAAFKYIRQQLLIKTWPQQISPQYLLLYGKFPGFIWP